MVRIRFVIVLANPTHYAKEYLSKRETGLPRPSADELARISAELSADSTPTDLAERGFRAVDDCRSTAIRRHGRREGRRHPRLHRNGRSVTEPGSRQVCRDHAK